MNGMAMGEGATREVLHRALAGARGDGHLELAAATDTRTIAQLTTATVDASAPVTKLGASAADAPVMTDDAHQLNLRARVQAYEANLIREALGLTGGNQRRAAALLELPLRTFERKIRKLLRHSQPVRRNGNADASVR